VSEFFSSWPLITDPWFYVVAVPAVLMMGLAKSGLISGFGPLAVPVLALAVPVPQAAAIMLPLMLVMDGVGVRALFAQRDAALVRLLLPAAPLTWRVILSKRCVPIVTEAGTGLRGSPRRESRLLAGSSIVKRRIGPLKRLEAAASSLRCFPDGAFVNSVALSRMIPTKQTENIVKKRPIRALKSIVIFDASKPVKVSVKSILKFFEEPMAFSELGRIDPHG
jgi:hypothetical protein